MKTWLVLATASAAAACSSAPPSKPFTACAIGSLTGTWHITYVETNGTCGPVSDETVVAGAAAPAGPSRCTIATQTISADRCTLATDFTCPLVAIAGTQHWVGSLRQVSPTELEGSMTASLSSPRGVCRSTYAVDWAQQ